MLVIQTAGFIFALTCLARALTLLRESLVAIKIGPTQELDIFFLVYATPLFLISALQNTLSAAWIPEFVLSSHRDSKIFSATVGYAQGITLLICLGVAIIFAMGGLIFLKAIKSQIDVSTIGQATTYIFILSSVIPAQGLSFVCAAALHAKNRFKLAAITPVFTPLLGILTLLGLKPDVIHFGLTFLIGSFVEAAVLFFAAKSIAGVMVPSLRRPFLTSFRTADAIKKLSFGSFLIGLIPLTNQFAAALTGTGGISQYVFSTRITASLVGVANIAISQAVLPVFTSSTNEKPKITILAKKLFLITFCGGSIVASGIAIFSLTLTKNMFGGGLFLNTDISSIAQAQTIYAFQIPTYLCWLLTCRIKSSLGDNNFMFKSSAMAALINGILSLFFAKYLGVSGVCLAASTTFLFIGALSFHMLFYDKKNIN